MADIISAVTGLVAVLLPVWLLWLFLHFRARRRQDGSLSEDEREQLLRLQQEAEQMAERIKNLELLLDEDYPQWREQDEEK